MDADADEEMIMKNILYQQMQMQTLAEPWLERSDKSIRT
ncbi:hypothetical protein LINPERHAP2_LOCUS14385 [Linum perenne]